MTNEELNHLELLAHRATPGEWKFWTSNSWRRLIASVLGDNKPVIMPFTARTDKQPDMSISQADMDFIEAAQPQNVLALIEENRRLRQATINQRDAWIDTRDDPAADEWIKGFAQQMIDQANRALSMERQNADQA